MDNIQRKAPKNPGQESVWDYPRPPRLEATTRHLRVVFAGVTIAATQRGYRTLETSHPPVYYLPTEDIQMQYLRQVPGTTFCEFKGSATYYTLTVGAKRAERAAWAYLSPVAAYAPLTGAIAFYANKMDACYVDDELVAPQPGDFYGGWVTSDIVGPFKGGPGTWGW